MVLLWCSQMILICMTVLEVY